MRQICIVHARITSLEGIERLLVNKSREAGRKDRLTYGTVEGICIQSDKEIVGKTIETSGVRIGEWIITDAALVHGV